MQNTIGPYHFTEIYQRVKIFTENGAIEENVELHVFVKRGPVIVDKLRERFKQSWNLYSEWKGEMPLFKHKDFKTNAELLFSQYNILLDLIKKTELVVKIFQERLPHYNPAKDQEVTECAAIMCKKDVERVIEDYTRFVAEMNENYLTNGVTLGVQTSTRLKDRYEWLKKAYDEQCGNVVDK